MLKQRNTNHNNNDRKDCTFTTITAARVPKEMRNPCIYRGYRLIDQPWSYYVKSLFHLHNETVNIWTHLVGLLVLMYEIGFYFNIYRSRGSDIQWTVLGFGSCCCFTLFNSAIAHWLHSKSPYVNYLIFMFDYIGVVFFGYGTAILAYYGVSTKDMYDLIGPHFMTLHVVLTYLNFLNICNTKLTYGHDLDNGRRKSLIVSGVVLEAIITFFPWFPRYTSCLWSDTCTLSSLNHITIVIISFTLMTLTYLLHQPERCCPGRFDIFGQSHQIFHIFVIVTQSLQLRALYVDFESGSNSHCKPDKYLTMFYIVLLYSACALSIIGLRPRIKRCLENNKKKT